VGAERDEYAAHIPEVLPPTKALALDEAVEYALASVD